jgi:hypothetical protein
LLSSSGHLADEKNIGIPRQVKGLSIGRYVRGHKGNGDFKKNLNPLRVNTGANVVEIEKEEAHNDSGITRNDSVLDGRGGMGK